MLSAIGSPLVAGGTSTPTMLKQPQTIWIRTTRAFMRNARPVPVSTVLEVPFADGATLIGSNKAVRVTAPTPPASAPTAAPQATKSTTQPDATKPASTKGV